MGPRAGLDAVVKRRIPSPCRELNPDRPGRSLVSIPTELSRLLIVFVFNLFNDAFSTAWSHGGLVSIVTRLRAGRLGFDSRQGLGSSSFRHRVQIGSGANPGSYSTGTGDSSLGMERPGRESDHSPPSSSRVECVELYFHSPNTSSWRDAWLSKQWIHVHGAVLS
jgi:hypothetical protein